MCVSSHQQTYVFLSRLLSLGIEQHVDACVHCRGRAEQALSMSGTAFVTGASRGIGLSLVQQLLRRFPALKVAAASRTASVTPELAALAEKYPGRLLPTDLDMSDSDSITEAAAAAVGKDEDCPLLFHGAAIMHPSGKGENTVARLNGADMGVVMSTNVVGPALLTGALCAL